MLITKRGYSLGIINSAWAIVFVMLLVSAELQAGSKGSFSSSKGFSSPKSSATSSFKYNSPLSSSKFISAQTAESVSSKKSFTTRNASGVVSSKFGSSYNSTIIEQQFAKQSANNSFKAFKKATPTTFPPHLPVTDLNGYRRRYSNNSTFSQAMHENDAWGTRNRYYQAQQPVIVNGGSNSFGLLSGMFLYSLLNNSASAGEYAFNHQHDEDYLKWRAEADRLAKDNAELSSQLNKMDIVKQEKNGMPNPDWLPEGVPASAVLSDEVLKSSQPDFNVCVGSEAGPYYNVAQSTILPNMIEWVNLNPIITQGTPDILEKIAEGKCDAGFIQGDATLDKSKLNVVFKPFLEAAHLACSVKVKSETINDLSGQAVWIPKNSGSRMTWNNLVSLNQDYGKITVTDAVNYEEAILKAIQTQSCLFYMAAPHASSIDRLIDRKGLKLLTIKDELLLKDGIYQARALSSSDYRRTIPSQFFSDGRIQTIVTPVTFVMSDIWTSTHPELAAKISLKLADIQNQIKQTVKQ